MARSLGIELSRTSANWLLVGARQCLVQVGDENRVQIIIRTLLAAVLQNWDCVQYLYFLGVVVVAKKGIQELVAL